jgi:hypothetical protein
MKFSVQVDEFLDDFVHAERAEPVSRCDWQHSRGEHFLARMNVQP